MNDTKRSLKRTQMNLLLILLFACFLNMNQALAQVIKKIEPGDGTLSAAILSANANDVLELSSGGIYTITNESGFGKIHFPLTIQVEFNAAEKAKLQLGEGTSTTKKYYFFEINDGAALTLKGLDISGLLDGEAVAASMLIFDARPDPMKAHIGNFRFDECIFHDFKDYIIHGMKDDYARGLIQDSLFINHVTVYNAKHFLQYKHVSLHHLEMTNSTVYHLTGMALKIGKIGYRCVLETDHKPYIAVSDSTITPTGFIDHCTLNDLGDIHGHVQVDNAYHTLTVSNCIVSNQQQFNQPALYFLDPAVDTAVMVKNTCFWNCAPPNDAVGGENWIGYQFSDTLNQNPDYRNANSGDFTLPENSILLNVGSDNYAIGDLRWVSEAVEITALSSMNLEIYNYPNPFKNQTTIVFTTKNSGKVTVNIFNSNGALVGALHNGKIQPGQHYLQWDAFNLKPGLYFLQIIKEGKVETLKMIHL